MCFNIELACQTAYTPPLSCYYSNTVLLSSYYYYYYLSIMSAIFIDAWDAVLVNACPFHSE